MNERTKLNYYRQLADKFLGRDLPWLQCAGPSTWQAMGLDAPVYAWEVDVAQVSASDLLKGINRFIHDAETALRGEVRVGYKNHVGFGVFFDERGYRDTDIVEALGQQKYVLIWGKTGCGKTTLVAHLVEHSGWETIVLYPKRLNPGKLPSGVQVVGGGGNWEAIDCELERLNNMMYQRNEESDPLYIVADDFWLWVAEQPSLINKLFRIVNIGRESNMFVHILNQSNRVKAMGLEGVGNLLDTFVEVQLKEVKGQRYGLIDYRDGVKRRFAHPGAWSAKQIVVARQPLSADEKVLVRYAHKIEPIDSFGLSKMYGVQQYLPNLSKTKIQQIAVEWEKAGLLLAAGDNTPRMVTEELLSLAK